MKALIVDDQASIHKFLDKMVDWGSLGISGVLHAYNGREALELIRERSPELMILDIKMPEVDGIGVLKRLEDGAFKPKTVILSAYDEFAYAREAMAFGVQHYLLKPIDIGPFAETVAKLAAETVREARERLERALHGIVRTQAPFAGLAQAAGQGLRLLGVDRYACVWQRLPEQAAGVPAADGAVAEAALSASERVAIYSLAPGQDAKDIVRLCGERRPEGAALGIGVERDALRLPDCVTAARAAARLAFYEEDGVCLYAGAPSGPEPDMAFARRYERELADMLEKGYSMPAFEQAVRALFAEFRRVKPDPGVACSACHHTLATLRSGAPAPDAAIRLDDLLACRHIETLQAEFLRHAERIVRSRGPRVPTALDAVREIKRYVEASVGEDLSLDTVSAQFIVNKYQLCRLFKSEFGVSYWSYVTQVRMGKAAELLLYTGMKISRIAREIGYPDESHFSNAFKRFYGISPKEYKQKNKQDSATFLQ